MQSSIHYCIVHLYVLVHMTYGYLYIFSTVNGAIFAPYLLHTIQFNKVIWLLCEPRHMRRAVIPATRIARFLMKSNFRLCLMPLTKFDVINQLFYEMTYNDVDLSYVMGVNG